ncbi:MAG: flagellar motor protein MotB [Alphaproteobacteria bacterium]|nr:flagellar motor protein MotB [Rhodospirillales bacterium]MCW9046356.1 flagellar motor protein MotB [Alphaproteobacteria bacterium]
MNYQENSSSVDVFGVGERSKSSKAWMVTFTDLVSLMLTFFVLLFSMSSVKVDKWDEMINALSKSLNPQLEERVTQPTAQFNISTVFRKRAINLEYLHAVIEEKLEPGSALSKTELKLLDDRLVISLPGDLFFNPGSAVLSKAAQEAMFELGGVLRNVDNLIGVNGHTDPVPLKSALYESNWELSLGRAISVSNALRRAGYTEEIMAFGYADSKIQASQDLSEAEQNVLARRVDVVVMPTDFTR